MIKTTQYAVYALLLNLLVFGGLSSASANQLSAVELDVPSFNLKGVDGADWNNESLNGKPWLINFWAVWCAPCLEELPALNRLWEKLEPHDIGMIALNIGEKADAIEGFLAQHDLTIDFPIVVGDKLKTLSNWSVRGLPHTVIINPNGKIVYQAIGPREWDDQAFVDAILALKDS